MSDRSPNNIKDVRDLLRLKGPEVLHNAPVREWHPTPNAVPGQAAAAGHSHAGSKRMLPYTHWKNTSFTSKAADLVHNLLLHGDASVVYGPSNVGKSFWGLIWQPTLRAMFPTGAKCVWREVR